MKSDFKYKLRLFLSSLVVFALVTPVYLVSAQESLTLDGALKAALENNEGIKAAVLEVNYFAAQKKAAADIGKFSATWMHGQYNSAYQDNNFTLSQSIPFPTVLTSEIRLSTEQVKGAEKNVNASKNELVLDVRETYLQLQYFLSLKKLLQTQDSLFTDFSHASDVRYKTGEGTLLERTTAEAQSLDAKNLLQQNDADIRIQQNRLKSLLKIKTLVTASDPFIARPVVYDTAGLANNPRLLWLRQQARIGKQANRVDRNKILPDLTIGYFNQSLRGVQNIRGQETYYGSSARFQGFQFGIAFPLWISPQTARIKASTVREEVLGATADYFETTLHSQYAQALLEYEKSRISLQYYQTNALHNAGLILQQAKKSFTAGEIGYLEYLQSLKTGLGIRSAYLNILNQYNHAIVKIEFLLGNY